MSTHRMQSVQSPIIPIVGQWIRETPGTISLGQGVVRYAPPPQALEQIQAFLSQPANHLYSAVEGIPELISAIRQKLVTDNGISLTSHQRILATAGANLAFSNAMFAITDPGDEIILPTPFYFNHDMAISLASCKTVGVPVDEHYQLRLEAIEAAITDRTRAIVTVSPNNPSGVIYPAEDLKAVNELCRKYGMYHIHDEAYEYFAYGEQEPFSPGSIPGSEAYTISIYSLSKSYGFASWRIGYMVIPEKLFEAVRKIQDTQLICPAVISQYAAMGALGAGKAWVKAQQQDIIAARKLMYDSLTELPFCHIPPTDGALYFLLKIDTKLPVHQLAEALVRQHQVAVIPGETFGIDNGCYVRVAFGALDRETVEVGVGRLVKGLRTLVE